MGYRSDLEDVDVVFQYQTEKAVCVRSDEFSQMDIWIPKSLCEIQGPNHTPRRGDIVTLTAGVRTLTEKGLI